MIRSTPAEKKLLAAILTDNRYARDVQDKLTEADFSDPRMGLVYERIMSAIARGERVDTIWVSNVMLYDDEVKGDAGDAAGVWDWSDPVPVPPGLFLEYVQSVKATATARGLDVVVGAVQQAVRDGTPPERVAEDAVKWMQGVADNAVVTRHLQPKLLREILEEDDEYDWVIPDLLERHDRLILTGTEGVGKTTFARQIVVLAAAGLHPLRFTRMHPVKCLVIDAENTERQWRRYVRGLARDAAEQGMIDPADHLVVQAGKRLDLTQGSDLAEIHQLIDKHNPDLLYIGPLYKLVPKAIYSDDDAAPLIVALDGLRERGLALIMEAHAGKAKDHAGDRNLEPRGSSQLLGWPEFGFGIRQNRDDPWAVDVVRWRGDREANRAWPTRLHKGTPWPWVDGSPTNGD